MQMSDDTGAYDLARGHDHILKRLISIADRLLISRLTKRSDRTRKQRRQGVYCIYFGITRQ
jgi:hypothetical protein